MTKTDNQRDVLAAKAVEAIRYQQRTADDARVLRNWQYMLYWRARNAQGAHNMMINTTAWQAQGKAHMQGDAKV